MKVKELRIGNYATIGNRLAHLEMKGIPLIVVGTELEPDSDFPDSTGSVELRTLDRLKYFHQFDEFILPIPLTEEWLLKFGFKDKSMALPHIVFDVANALTWNESSKTLTFGYYGELKCEYVHQLQNLYFALTGEELTIINSK